VSDSFLPSLLFSFISSTVSKGQPILPVLLILGKQSVLTFCSLEAANVIEVTGSSKTKDLRKTFIPIADYIAQYEVKDIYVVWSTNARFYSDNIRSRMSAYLDLTY
jgi:hypothetical protein